MVVDPDAVAASLIGFLAEAELVRTGKACWVPQPELPETPAKMMVIRTLDRIHQTLTAEANAAKQAKRAAKIERRRLRREQAAREGATEAKTHGLPVESAPPPAPPAAPAAPPIAEEPPAAPIPPNSLRF